MGHEDERAGPSETPSPSDLIVAAVAGSHVLTTSEPHCDQDRLARVIHTILLFRGRPLVSLGRAPVTPCSPDVEPCSAISRSTGP